MIAVDVTVEEVILILAYESNENLHYLLLSTSRLILYMSSISIALRLVRWSSVRGNVCIHFSRGGRRGTPRILSSERDSLVMCGTASCVLTQEGLPASSLSHVSDPRWLFRLLVNAGDDTHPAT